MTDIAIMVDGLGKRYRLGQKQAKYETLRDSMVEVVGKPFRWVRNILSVNGNGSASNGEWLWALKDVSFKVHRGEVVGIIGRNGAGKSTLLKILSRITEPTEGSAEIHGRVVSLLEVGTGFHSELTGRENVYLNGAILGMKKREIDSKFDEIVAFAEVEKFIDTPVKHYSSGMHLRLAFAVAAHLEPEILIVDEVLAVGDAAFQKKCLGKMGDVAKEGRTVLFVSHNMPAVTRLCERVILIEEGKIKTDGSSQLVVSKYLNNNCETGGTTALREWNDLSKAPAGEMGRLRAVRIRTLEGRIESSNDIRQPVGLQIEYDVLRPDFIALAWFNVFNDAGVFVLDIVDLDPEWRRRPRPVGKYIVTAWIPGNLLSEGLFVVSAGVTSLDPPILQFEAHDAVAFHIHDSLDGDSARGDWAGTMSSVVRPLLQWETRFDPVRVSEKLGSNPATTTSS
jgi:lipopolysaccharide transport system ATP-binding protein